MTQYTSQISATDSDGNTAYREVVFQVIAPPVTIASQGVMIGNANAASLIDQMTAVQSGLLVAVGKDGGGRHMSFSDARGGVWTEVAYSGSGEATANVHVRASGSPLQAGDAVTGRSADGTATNYWGFQILDLPTAAQAGPLFLAGQATNNSNTGIAIGPTPSGTDGVALAVIVNGTGSTPLTPFGGEDGWHWLGINSSLAALMACGWIYAPPGAISAAAVRSQSAASNFSALIQDFTA